MKIKDRWEFATKPPPFALQGDEKVSTAITSMAQRNIGSVVIVDDTFKVQGMVTERDLVRRLLAENLDPDKTTLGVS